MFGYLSSMARTCVQNPAEREPCRTMYYSSSVVVAPNSREPTQPYELLLDHVMNMMLPSTKGIGWPNWCAGAAVGRTSRLPRHAAPRLLGVFTYGAYTALAG